MNDKRMCVDVLAHQLELIKDICKNVREEGESRWV